MMDNKNPLVTVMIPTYNQFRYINKTLKSVLEQSYRNIEIIVSDDSPNKITENIVRNYSYDNRIKYIHHEKAKGRVSNYHYILYEMARGDWVINLDGDDYFEDKNFIQNAVNIVTKYPDVIMVIGQQKIYNEITRRFYYPQKIIEKDFQFVAGNWLFLNTVFKNIEIPHLASFYRRERAMEIGFYDINIDISSSDRLSLLKLILNKKVALLNSYVGVWVHHKKNKSKNMNFRDVCNNLKLYNYLFIYARHFSNIPLILLFVWKIVGQYKHIYGYAIESIEKGGMKQFFDYYRFLTKDCILFCLILTLDIRIYRKMTKL